MIEDQGHMCLLFDFGHLEEFERRIHLDQHKGDCFFGDVVCLMSSHQLSFFNRLSSPS